MGTENRASAGGHFLQFLHEDRAHFTQFIDHMLVMDDFLPHIHWGAIQIQRNLHYIDRTHDAGAKTARLEQINLLFSAVIGGDWFQWHGDFREISKYIIWGRARALRSRSCKHGSITTDLERKTLRLWNFQTPRRGPA